MNQPSPAHRATKPRTYRVSCPGRMALGGQTLPVARSYAAEWGPEAMVMCEQTLDVVTTPDLQAASLWRRINNLRLDLADLEFQLEDSDGDGEELHNAIRAQKKRIAAIELELTALGVAEAA